MPIPIAPRFRALLVCLPGRWLAMLGMSWGIAACQPQQDQAAASPPPPIGHFEGSISPAGQPEARAALDIRHPSPGHYEAEFTVSAAPALSFVADTILLANNELRLKRPGRPGQKLTLKLDGDFWRGALVVDSASAPALLVKRGAPTPTTYRVEHAPQAAGAAWLFAPADTSTPGAALALLPTTETATSAALWADALAREGVIVLLLPAVDTATAATETTRLQTALRLLRNTAGADTATIGAWAVGPRATALAQALTEPAGPQLAFIIVQNAEVDATGRTLFRELKTRKVPIMGLYGGPLAAQRAAALRSALGSGRRASTVRSYRGTTPELLVSGGLAPSFGPGLPGEVVDWLRAR